MKGWNAVPALDASTLYSYAKAIKSNHFSEGAGRWA
jgi:hypothetical protein